MADKFAGGIIASSADVSISVLLRVKSDGAELTGKIASAVDCHYWRQGGLVVTFTAATLASADGTHSDGGWFIMNDTLMPGAYRLDLPDAAVAPGADWVVIGVKDTAASGFAFYERYALATGVYLADDAITSAKVAAGALTYDDQITTFKSELSGLVVALPDGHITSAKIGADAIGSDKVAANALVYGDHITAFDASIKSAASSAWSDAAAVVRVYPANGSISAAVLDADCITSAKVAAGAFTYDDQITTFKSELSGLIVNLPDDHITSAKIAAGALVYDDQIVTFKSELSGMVVSLPDGHITSAKIGADAIGSDKVAAGALSYADQIAVFDASIQSAASAALAAWGKTDFRLSTQGVRDITQYTSAQGGFPGSSPAMYDALCWNVAMAGFQRIQTPTTYLVHYPAGTAMASAPVSGDSASVTIGIFTNV